MSALSTAKVVDRGDAARTFQVVFFHATPYNEAFDTFGAGRGERGTVPLEYLRFWERADLCRCSALNLTFVPGHVDVLRGGPGAVERTLHHRLRVGHERDDGPIGGVARVDVQQRDAGRGRDRRRYGVNHLAARRSAQVTTSQLASSTQYSFHSCTLRVTNLHIYTFFRPILDNLHVIR